MFLSLSNAPALQLHDNNSTRDRLLAVSALLTLFTLPTGTAPAAISSGCMLAVWLFSGAWRKNRDWWLEELHWMAPVLLVMLLPWASLLWTINPDPGLYPYLQRTHFWLFSLVMACITLRDVKPAHLAIVFIAGVELVTLVFFLVQLGAVTSPKITAYFLFRSYITYSLLLALATAWISFLFREASDTRHKAALLALIALNMVAIALLKGRSGHLAFFTLAPVMAINLVGLHRKWLLALTGLLLSGALLLSPIVQQRIQLVISEIRLHMAEQNSAPVTSVGIRLALWQGGLQTFRDYPILGAGIDGYQIVMQRIFPYWEISGTVKNPHNFYLYIAASYGVVGIALHLWLFIAVIRRAWPCRNRWQGFICLTTIMVVAVGSLTEVTPLQPQTGILLAMMIGLPDEG